MVYIDVGVFFYAAFLIMVFPAQWAAAAVSAAALHELGHLAAAKVLKGKITFLKIHMTGAEIGTVLPGNLHEAVVALAGPTVSLVLLFLYDQTPRLSVCGCVQGLYNLLPVYPLDGGRILRCLTQQYAPEISGRICLWAQAVTYLCLGAAAMTAVFTWKLGIWPIFVMLFLMSGKIRRKIPCKPMGIGVQ